MVNGRGGKNSVVCFTLVLATATVTVTAGADQHSAVTFCLHFGIVQTTDAFTAQAVSLVMRSSVFNGIHLRYRVSFCYVQ